jgi:hypothetical protein
MVHVYKPSTWEAEAGGIETSWATLERPRLKKGACGHDLFCVLQKLSKDKYCGSSKLKEVKITGQLNAIM